MAFVLLLAGPLWAGGLSQVFGRVDLQALAPTEHRHDDDLHWLTIYAPELVTGRVANLALEERARALDNAPRLLAREFGPDYRPLGPPRGEARAWLDEHREWAIPWERDRQLQSLLTDAAIEGALDRLMANLSRLSFGLSGANERRDPLGLQRHTHAPPGWYGPLQHGTGSTSTGTGPTLDEWGSLRSARGDQRLVAVHSQASVDELRDRAEAVVAPLGLSVEVDGVRATNERADRRLRPAIVANFMAIWAALLGALALALRRIRRSCALAACILSATIIAPAAFTGLDAWSWPLCLLAMLAACDLVLGGPSLARHRWATLAVWATLGLPLALSPYPGWRVGAYGFWLTLASAALVLAAVLPALLEMSGAMRQNHPSWAGAGAGAPARARANSMPSWWGPRGHPFAALCTGLVIATGFIYVYPDQPWRGPTTLADRHTQAAVRDPAQAQPFDVDRSTMVDRNAIVWHDHIAADPAQALDAASRELAQLHARLGKQWSRHIDAVDGAASYVVAGELLELRDQHLQAFSLEQRRVALERKLAARGLHPDAFAPAFGSAWHGRGGPSAAALLDSGLAPWAQQQLQAVNGGSSTRARTKLQLSPMWVEFSSTPTSKAQTRRWLAQFDEAARRGRDRRGGVRPAAPLDPSSEPASTFWHDLSGPTIAELSGRLALPKIAGGLLLLQALLAGLIVGVATRCWRTALVSIICAGLACLALLVALFLLGIVASPTLLPMASFAVAASCLGAARACRTSKLGESNRLSEWIGAPACAALVGLSLASSSYPGWTESGWCLLASSLIALWLSLTVAPGLFRWVRSGGHGLLAGTVVALLALPPQQAQAASTPASEVAPLRDRDPRIAASKPLRKFLALWRKTTVDAGFTASYTSTRQSSLLMRALQQSGRVRYAPQLGLSFVDDGAHAIELHFSPSGSSSLTSLTAGSRPQPGGRALDWLGRRLVALFGHGRADRLLAESVIRVDRRGHRMVLSPRPHSPLRELLRELRVTLDRNSGRVVQLRLTTRLGDELTVRIASHLELSEIPPTSAPE